LSKQTIWMSKNLTPSYHKYHSKLLKVSEAFKTLKTVKLSLFRLLKTNPWTPQTLESQI